MRCAACEPDYCACADFYAGRMSYWKGEIMPEADECPCQAWQGPREAAEVQPVAWLYESRKYGRELILDGSGEYAQRLRDLGYEVIPLYAAPAQPSADVAELVALLHQYRSDMKHPPAPDSRERRVAMIDAAIAKFGRDA